jgi:8-oxo-dGTP diphosphatase
MINVVAGLIKINNKYLIAKRIDGEPTGLYEFPGGKINPGETAEAAIKREVKEELELDVKVIKYLTKVSYKYPTRTVKISLYLVQYISGDIKLNAHSSYKLLALAEIKNYPLAPADDILYNYLIKHPELLK